MSWRDILQQVKRWSKESFPTLAKTALVRLPRAVPLQALKITNPRGPIPFKLHLPSRQPGRSVQVFIFLPPVDFPDLESGDATPNPNVFTVIMDYHGGGFYLGSCLEQAPFCSKLCLELGAIVVSVDYRMAPFDKFPAAIEDAEDVVKCVLDPGFPGYKFLRQNVTSFFRLQWHQKIDTIESRDADGGPLLPTPKVELDIQRIGLSGASSGGNIALNMAIDTPAGYGLLEWPSPIPSEYSSRFPLLLLYPSLDLRQLPSERFRHGHMRTVKPGRNDGGNVDDQLAATYVSRKQAAHPRASPGLVDTSLHLHKKAKSFLILPGLDTLWEQSEIWTTKVAAEGRREDVKTLQYENMKHGWTLTICWCPTIPLYRTLRKWSSLSLAQTHGLRAGPHYDEWIPSRRSCV
ncbi:hypothetical protein KC318_g160 [Hortaea werneckii]|uniref:Alpha/beta hydrolase fold-3 domain-containing protein n=1 Tax=Hortaea werneckii TaxID=91943 RepID=A0A3M7BN98_HORWE|nr:hypothetical protein KC334_g153 [Hortaea werneckii]KAI7027967.1 hypothetical protein KC355_g142 [Hortaea werneckii]KAI7676604.1 hypothetical protein KC318_g160 [Hortaea werneckii]RMY25408.1 hypothetical protein D0867_00741 [Hortaea werneckii]RMY41086.1 hypothetical protein D0866_00833 [Hortaea werneckii]